MEIMRKYVMGYQPVRIQIISDYQASRILGAWDPDGKGAGKGGAGAGAGAASSSGRHDHGAGAGAGAGAGKASKKRQRAVVDEDEDEEEDGRGAGAGAGSRRAASRSRGRSASTVPSAPVAEPAEPMLPSGTLGHGGLFHRVNFEDPNYNIDLPVFSIHGNHDDPSREGPTGEVLAALDVLAVANLVNYFGKSESADLIEVAPILMAKGRTRIALYGLGNIRDDRLHRVLLADKVRFRRPTGDPDAWFSMMMVHQNRDNRGLRGRSGNTGMEAVLPAFLDLVVSQSQSQRGGCGGEGMTRGGCEGEGV
jgi:hypothetical protein